MFWIHEDAQGLVLGVGVAMEFIHGRGGWEVFLEIVTLGIGVAMVFAHEREVF
jgi:hypothetical protein